MATLTPDLLHKKHACWRAAIHQSVGQIHAYANPLLGEPCTLKRIKRWLLDHWRSTLGLNFLYVHLTRPIKEHDLDMINMIGPRHGGAGRW